MRRIFFLLLPALLLAFVGTVAAVDVGQPAPEIGLNDLAGQPVRIAGLRGKVVLVDFWATWCSPCRLELPFLDRLSRQYAAQGLVVVGVSVDNELSNVRSFLARNPVGFRVAHDARKAVVARYGGQSMPSSYLVDRRGRVRYYHGGFFQRDVPTIEREVQGLLREAP
jgi:peroxiredoxin